MAYYRLDGFLRFRKEGKIGEVIFVKVLPDCCEVRHFFGDNSGPAPSVAELKIARDNVPDVFLQCHQVCCRFQY
jgi:hypothetical protein